MEKLPISLIAVVHNAEADLQRLIESHRDVVSEVVIVDQGSTDTTYAIACKYADKVFKRRCKGVSDPDRNWAFMLGSQPYVLYLDSDEHLSPETKALLPAFVAGDFDIVWFKRQNLVNGVDIKEICGEDIQSRLFKQGAIRFPDKNHTHAEAAMDTKVLYSEGVIVHTRTFEGLKKANRARNGLYDPEHVAMQERFITAVDGFLKKEPK